MNVEACLTKLGRTNKWIITWFLVISFAKTIPSVFSMFAFQFTAPMPSSFHCNLPPNVTMSQFIPLEFKNEKWVFSSCKQFSNFTNSSIIPCQNGYNYTLKYFRTSIVTEWNLVCDRQILNVIATSSFFVMSFFGAIVNCNLADRYGRKMVFLVVFACLNLSQFVQSFVSNIYIHIFLKLLAGMFQQGCMVTGFTMGIEFFPLKDRSTACLVDTFIWTLSCFLLVFIVYFIQEWRFYFIATTVIMIPFCFMYCYLPESIRWLMSNRKIEDAQILLKKAAKYSSPPLPESTFDKICSKENSEEYPRYNITFICRDSLLLKFQLINTIIWFVTAMTFYGLQVKVVEIGNPYFNFFLATLAEVPANIFAFPLANKFGRKIIIGASSILVAVFIIIGFIFFQYISNPWPATLVFLIGKMFNTVVFNLIFMHTSEIFPTTLRSTAVGLSSSSARLGASVGAALFQFPRSYEYVPFVILAIGCFVVGIIVFCLPETYRQKLPTTIEEIKDWVKDKNSICLR